MGISSWVNEAASGVENSALVHVHGATNVAGSDVTREGRTCGVGRR